MNTTLLFPRDLLRFIYWLYFRPMSLYRYTQKLDKDLYSTPFDVTPNSRSNPAIKNLMLLSVTSLILLSVIFTLIQSFVISKLGYDIDLYVACAGLLGFFIGHSIILGAFLKQKKVSGLVNWVYTLALSVVLFYTFTAFLSHSTWQELIQTTIKFFGGETTYNLLRMLGLGFAVGFTTFFFSVNVTYNVAWINGIVPLATSSIFFSTDGIIPIAIIFGTIWGLETHTILANSSSEKTWRGLINAGVASVLVWIHFSRLQGFNIEMIALFFLLLFLCYLIFAFRLPFYIIELLINFTLYLLAKIKTISPLTSIRLSPIYWDEIIHLPLLGLDWHVEFIRTYQNDSASQFTQDITSSLYQGWAVNRALIEMAIGDIEHSNNINSIAQFSQVLSWLPPSLPKELEDILPPIRKIAEHIRSSSLSDTLYNKKFHLQQGLQQTKELIRSLSISSNRRAAIRISGALSVWVSIIQSELAEVSTNEIIPNVYVAGLPLDKASNVFKGRRDLFVMLENELSSPSAQRPTLLLFGARRTGKTSVLKQLPVRLGPSVIPAEVDLQFASTAQSVASFLYFIAEKIRSDIAINARIQITPLSEAQLNHEPYIAFLDWIKEIEVTIGEHWLLLAFDEYETLEKMLERKRIDEGIFQLIRGIIQHHPKITILFSGSHTLEDLSAVWSNYLVNVRVLHVGPLASTEAVELLTTPIDNFPLKYKNRVVDYILNITGCQPYLLQSTGRELVNLLNEKKVSIASIDDVVKAFDLVLTSSSAYFNELWTSQDMDDIQRKILISMAGRNEKIVTTDNLKNIVGNNDNYRIALQLLIHRDVLKQKPEGYSFATELVRKWIQRTKILV